MLLRDVGKVHRQSGCGDGVYGVLGTILYCGLADVTMGLGSSGYVSSMCVDLGCEGI